MGVTAWPRVVWGDTLAESCEGDSLAESCWRVTVWLTGVGVTAWPRVVGGGGVTAWRGLCGVTQWLMAV